MMTQRSSLDGSLLGLVRRLCSLAAVCVLLLTGCGGGGGGGSSSSSSATSTGTLTLRLIGGSSADYAHVNISLTAVAFNADANKPWSATDSSWQVVTFSSPIAVDLANLANGNYATVLSGQSLPTGTYRQMRLFAAASGQATDANNVHAPIEWPDTLLGLRVPVNFAIAQNALTQIYVQWDLGHSLVPLLVSGGSATALSLRPNLNAIDLASSSGAIVGKLNATDFCLSASRTNCISNVVATAQVASADGSRHITVLSTQITQVDSTTTPPTATFRLFPLPSGGTFDVVFTGRNMRPFVVTSVTAAVIDLFTNGTHINNSSSVSDVAISVTRLTPDASSAVLALAAPRLADASVWIGQSLSSSTAPYEWAAAYADPLTGSFPLSTYLPSGASIDVAPYTGSALVFSTVSAAEGAGRYRIKSYGTSYDFASSLQTVAPPAVITGVTSDTSLAVGNIAVTVVATNPASYDHAQVVVSDVNGVVLTRDVSSQINSPTPVLLSVPVGSNAAALGGTAVYSVAVRGWLGAAPQTATWVRSATALDLRAAAASSTASVTLTLP